MPERFILSVLGSASAKPNQYRQSSAQLLQAAGRLFLIDCSEDTQRRLVLQNARLAEYARENSLQGVRHVNATRLDAVFISHIHGDHVYGLFPLLDTLSLNARTRALKIFGPANLGPILTFYNSFWGRKNPFDLEFNPLKSGRPEVVLEYPDLVVEAVPLNHGIETYGFIFRETLPPVREGEQVHLRSFAYCSDTAPFEELASWIRGVDVLYHEGTYMEDDWRKAQLRFHSTAAQAAKVALDAGVGRLLLGHYSSSIREDEIHGAYENEARRIFPASTAVEDGEIFDI